MPARPGPLALLVAGVLVLSACGGDDPEIVTEAPPGTDQPSDGKRLKPGDGRGGVKLVEIAKYQVPVYVTQPPGERDDIYVVQQSGQIIRTDRSGEGSTFLDLSSEISFEGERGLLSMAFAPDYEQSGLFYVDYTNSGGDTRIVEFESDGSTADPASAREVLAIDQPFSNHNGGQLQFGPDGFLYIGMGDGGDAGDPQRNAQNPDSLLGKLLRIDPSETGENDYGIPESNPFADGADGRPEIYSTGLRNPWRFSFDRMTGALSIGDVGQFEIEEVDLVARNQGSGANFGWSAFEGENRFNDDQQAPGQVEPVAFYTHEEGCSITGGYVVRDPKLPSLYGRYLYADLCVGELRSFTARPGRRAIDDRPLGLTVPQLSSFGEDTRGRVYVASLDPGVVYRLAAN